MSPEDGHDDRGTTDVDDVVRDRCDQPARVVVTSSVDSDAQQGDGPAAASASSAAYSDRDGQTCTVTVVVGANGAAAACPVAAVAVGPHGIAAASPVGVVAVGVSGAAATSNAANSSSVVVDAADRHPVDGRPADAPAPRTPPASTG